MTHLIRQFIVPVTIFSIVLVATACAARPAQQDIAPVPAQAIPEKVLPTPTPVRPASPAPTLRTEIVEPTAPNKMTEPVTPASPIVPTETLMTPLSSQSVTVPPEGQAALAKAIADLAKQTGLPEEKISLVSMKAVDWSDTSLGCPQEGMMYAQVITPGFQIILAAQGQQYDYRTDQQGNNVRLCQQ